MMNIGHDRQVMMTLLTYSQPWFLCLVLIKGLVIEVARELYDLKVFYS